MLPALVLDLEYIGITWGEMRVAINRSATPYTTGQITGTSGGQLIGTGTGWSVGMVGGSAKNVGALKMTCDDYKGAPFSVSQPCESWYQIVALTDATHLAIHTFSIAADAAYRGRATNPAYLPTSYEIRPAVRVMKISGARIICEPSTHVWNVGDLVEQVICPYPDATAFNLATVGWTAGGSWRSFFNISNRGARAFENCINITAFSPDPAPPSVSQRDDFAWYTGISVDQAKTGIGMRVSDTAISIAPAIVPLENMPGIDWGGAGIIRGLTNIGLQIEWNARTVKFLTPGYYQNPPGSPTGLMMLNQCRLGLDGVGNVEGARIEMMANSALPRIELRQEYHTPLATLFGVDMGPGLDFYFDSTALGGGVTHPLLLTSKGIGTGLVWHTKSSGVTLVNGLNDGVICTSSRMRITGPTAAFSIGSLGVLNAFSPVAGDGASVTLYNTTAFNMTIVNNNANSGGFWLESGILTMTGANLVIPGPGSVTCLYDTTQSRWIVTSSSVVGGSGGSTSPGGSNTQVQYNNSGAFGGYTNTQLTALLDAFTSSLKGVVPASGGGTTNFLRADGSWTAPPGGGGGTPGGSSGQIQFNSSSAFAGMAGTSWDDTNRSLTMTGATVTTSKPIIDMAQTWNASGVVFTGVKLNITPTARADLSKLLDIQSGGITQISVVLPPGGGPTQLNFGAASSSNPALRASSANIQAVRADGSALSGFSASAADGYNTPSCTFNNSTLYLGYSGAKIQFGSAGDPTLYRDAAEVLAIRDGTNATTLRVYNTWTDASNYERASIRTGISTTTTQGAGQTVNIVGGEQAGTGSDRVTIYQSQGGNRMYFDNTSQVAWCFRNAADNAYASISCGSVNFTNNLTSTGSGYASFAGNSIVIIPNGFSGFGTDTLNLTTGRTLGFTGGASGISNAPDLGLSRAAALVLQIGSGIATNATGWVNWGGQARVTGDVSSNNTTVLATATGLSIALQAGRTYAFDVYLSFTCTAAQGIRAAMVASGSLSATAIEYDGWIVDSVANGIKGNAQSAALGTVVANAAMTGTAGVVQIKGVITVNVAGTLNVQFAQSVAAANNTTVKRGSYMLIHDMP